MSVTTLTTLSTVSTESTISAASTASTDSQFNVTSTTAETPHEGHDGNFFEGYISALSLIFLSEFGDRTFFLTAILSINHSRAVTFMAALLALFLNSMTACGFGVLLGQVPAVYIYWLSIILFTAFGLKTIYDAYYMPPNNEEYFNAQTARNNSKRNENQSNNPTQVIKSVLNQSQNESQSAHSENQPEKGILGRLKRVWSSFFFSTFLIILVAELADRSQVTVVVLAARENFYGVALGALVAQFISTFIAVLGGHYVGEKVSVRLVTFISGLLFLVFAVVAAVKGVPRTNGD